MLKRIKLLLCELDLGYKEPTFLLYDNRAAFGFFYKKQYIIFTE